MASTDPPLRAARNTLSLNRSLEDGNFAAGFKETHGHSLPGQQEYQQQRLLGGCAPAAAPLLETRSSSAVWAGRRGEDRLVSVCRSWPAYDHDCQPGPAAAADAPHSSMAQQYVPRQYHLLAAFDGHNGAAAASFAADLTVPVVEEQLTLRAGQRQAGAGPSSLAAQLQGVVIHSFLELQRRFARTGSTGGCTATVVLQVDRLVTVGSLGSTCCVLDTGSEQPLLELTADHVIGSNPLEKRRLAAAGCLVAELDRSGCGPAHTPYGGDGVLRLWPGGLTLSRAIGDFNLNMEAGLLPLPHIKQVLLPPSGGRLVLATHGVWSRASSGVRRAMREAALHTAAHAVLKAVHNGRGGGQVDASIIIADVLPPGTTFEDLRRQPPQQGQGLGQQQLEGGRASSGLQRALQRLLPSKARSSGGSSSSRSSSSSDEQEPPGREVVPAATQVLADFDSAAVVGLVPVQGSSSSSSSSGAAFSRSSSGSSRWSGRSIALPRSAAGTSTPAQAAPGVHGALPAEGGRVPAGPLPTWKGAPTKAQMLGTLAEMRQLWVLARRRRRAAETAAAAAEAVAIVDAERQAAGRRPAAAASPFEAAAEAGPAPPPSPRLLQLALTTMRVASLPRGGSAASSSSSEVPPSGSATPHPPAATLRRASSLVSIEEEGEEEGEGKRGGAGAGDERRMGRETEGDVGPRSSFAAFQAQPGEHLPHLQTGHSLAEASGPDSGRARLSATLLAQRSGSLGSALSVRSSSSSMLWSPLAPETPASHGGEGQPASSQDLWMRSYSVAAGKLTSSGSGLQKMAQRAVEAAGTSNSLAEAYLGAASRVLYRRSTSMR